MLQLRVEVSIIRASNVWNSCLDIIFTDLQIYGTILMIFSVTIIIVSKVEFVGHSPVAQIDNHSFADGCIDGLIILAVLSRSDFELLGLAGDVHSGAHPWVGAVGRSIIHYIALSCHSVIFFAAGASDGAERALILILILTGHLVVQGLEPAHHATVLHHSLHQDWLFVTWTITSKEVPTLGHMSLIRHY